MEPVENGASLISWNNHNLFWWLDELRGVDELRHKLDDTQVYVCQIPKSKGNSCNYFSSQC